MSGNKLLDAIQEFRTAAADHEQIYRCFLDAHQKMEAAQTAHLQSHKRVEEARKAVEREAVSLANSQEADERKLHAEICRVYGIASR